MLKAVLDYKKLTGISAGIKVAGGIRDAKDAIRYLVLINEEMGDEWLRPELFRFGASSLLDDVLKQLNDCKEVPIISGIKKDNSWVYLIDLIQLHQLSMSHYFYHRIWHLEMTS